MIPSIAMYHKQFMKTSVICLYTVKWSNSSISNNLGTVTPSQNEPGSDGNEGVLRVPRSSSITGASPSEV